jgi:hypothetical protein
MSTPGINDPAAAHARLRQAAYASQTWGELVRAVAASFVAVAEESDGISTDVEMGCIGMGYIVGEARDLAQATDRAVMRAFGQAPPPRRRAFLQLEDVLRIMDGLKPLTIGAAS